MRVTEVDVDAHQIAVLEIEVHAAEVHYFTVEQRYFTFLSIVISESAEHRRCECNNTPV